MQVLAKVVTLLMVLTSFATRMVEEKPATVETFPLYHQGKPLCFTGEKDKWRNPKIAACSDSTKKEMIAFEWDEPYLTLFDSEYFGKSRKHYFGKADTYNESFANWGEKMISDAKYQWKKNGNVFTNKKYSEYEVERADDSINNLHVKLEPMLQLYGGSIGQVVMTIKFKRGYSSTNKITSEINSKVSVEAKANLIKIPIELGVSSEASQSVLTSAEFSVNEEFDDQMAITADLSKPLYVYLTSVSFKFLGNDYTVHGGLVTSPVPLHT